MATEQEEKGTSQVGSNGQADGPPDDELVGRGLVEKIATSRPEKMDVKEAADALSWFLSDDEDADAEPVTTLRINVGKRGADGELEDFEVAWRITPVGSERMDDLRKQCTRKVPGARRRQQQGQMEDMDSARFDALLVFEATVEPDLSEVMRVKEIADPALVINHRFRHRPLLVSQIAREVLNISGGDTDDVARTRDLEVTAAGNS